MTTDDALDRNKELQGALLEQDIPEPEIPSPKEVLSAPEQASPSDQEVPTKSSAPVQDNSPKKTLVPSSLEKESLPERIPSGDITSGDAMVSSSPLKVYKVTVEGKDLDVGIRGVDDCQSLFNLYFSH